VDTELSKIGDRCTLQFRSTGLDHYRLCEKGYLRHGLRHANHYVSECLSSETFLGGKSTDAAITMQTGDGGVNR